MATNYIEDGESLTLIAPAGGVVSGVPLVINTLMVVPLTTAAEGETFAGKPKGVWKLGCTAGLKAGVKVSLKAGALVADGTAASLPFGKLTADEAGGFAPALLIQQ